MSTVTAPERPAPRAPLTAGVATTGAANPLAVVRQSLALAWRGLIKIRRTPEALIDVTIQPTIFLGLFVTIFGSAVAGSRHDYLTSLLPGLLAQSIATAAVAIGVNLNTDLEKGVFDRFRSLPIARSAPLIGAVLADAVRYTIVTIMTLVPGYAMGYRISTSAFGLVAGALLAIGFGLCISWISVFVGMMVRTSGAVQGIMFMLVLPLSFGADIFVPVDTLPGWMQAIVRINPLTHLVRAMRGLWNGGAVAADVWLTLGWMAAFVAVFMPLALRAYRRRA
ncbi:MAG: ABC transporter permease [Kineosporiaceae bacterium]